MERLLCFELVTFILLLSSKYTSLRLLLFNNLEVELTNIKFY